MVHSDLKQNQPKKSCKAGVRYAAVLPAVRGFRRGTTRPGASPLGLERGRKPRIPLILNGEGTSILILIFLGHSGASKSVIRSEIRRARAGGFWREKRQAGGGARGGAQACGEAVGTFTADPPVLRDCWVLLLTF